MIEWYCVPMIGTRSLPLIFCGVWAGSESRVQKKWGYPVSSLRFIDGCSLRNHPFLGTPISGNPHLIERKFHQNSIMRPNHKPFHKPTNQPFGGNFSRHPKYRDICIVGFTTLLLTTPGFQVSFTSFLQVSCSFAAAPKPNFSQISGAPMFTKPGQSPKKESVSCCPCFPIFPRVVPWFFLGCPMVFPMFGEAVIHPGVPEAPVAWH